MNKSIQFGLLSLLFFFIFSDMFFKEKQEIIEKFSDSSPRLIHVTKNILGEKILIRTIEYWENGKIRYDKNYKNGRPEGKQLFYSKSGEKTEQWIKNGQRDGIYTQWNVDNEITLQEKWKRGKRIKLIISSNTK